MELADTGNDEPMADNEERASDEEMEEAAIAKALAAAGAAGAGVDEEEGDEDEDEKEEKVDVDLDDGSLQVIEELSKTKQEAWLPKLKQERIVAAAKKSMVSADATLKEVRNKVEKNEQRITEAREAKHGEIKEAKVPRVTLCLCGHCLRQQERPLVKGSNVCVNDAAQAVRQHHKGASGRVLTVEDGKDAVKVRLAEAETVVTFKSHELDLDKDNTPGYSAQLERTLALHDLVYSPSAKSFGRITNILGHFSHTYIVQCFNGDTCHSQDHEIQFVARGATISPAKLAQMKLIGQRVRMGLDLEHGSAFVAGYCLRGMLLVSEAKEISLVAPGGVILEEQWAQQALPTFRANVETFEEEQRIAQEAAEAAHEKYGEEFAILSPLQMSHKEAHDRLEEATKHAETAELVTAVKFREGCRKPSGWRDLERYVDLEWVVQVGTPTGGSRPKLLNVTEGAVLAHKVLEAAAEAAEAESKFGPSKKHILAVRSEALPAARELAPDSELPEDLADNALVALGRREANKIKSTASKAVAPALPPCKFALLKAALGANKGLVLDTAVEEFLLGEETGLVRRKETPLPSTLKGTLRPYQKQGFNWLCNNAANGFGSILADDMGLGKTLQALSFLTHCKEKQLLRGPALVVVPKSLMFTWEKEVAKFAPTLRVHLFHGPGRRLLRCAQTKFVQAAAKLTSLPPRMRATGKRAPTEAETQRITQEAAQAQLSVQLKDKLVTPAKKRSKPSASQQPGPENAGANEEATQLGTAALETPPKRKRQPKSFGFSDLEADIFLTSYGTLRHDHAILIKEQRFSSIILDEAQNIKCSSSRISKAIKATAFAVGNVRIALSGTPVENKLTDLHSLFDFILPGYLASSRTAFEREFGQPIEATTIKKKPAGGQEEEDTSAKELAATRLQLLQRLIQPFHLRRLKSDPTVAPDLPEKIITAHMCELSEPQVKLYKEVEDQMMKKIEEDGQSAVGRHGRIIAALHAFRQTCNHPATLGEKQQPANYDAAAWSRTEVAASGKCIKLHELLGKIFTAGEKALIFCNYLTTVEMLAEQIQDRHQVSALKMIGQVDCAGREKIVADFQEKEGCKVLILTLKTGGLGLTLTSATHVIHFDRSYNPAIEDQATDRTHRIGQKATVCVHQLVTKDTVEERLAAILESKRSLSRMVVAAGEHWIADLSDKEIRELFCLTGEVAKAAAVQARRPAKKAKTEEGSGAASSNGAAPATAVAVAAEEDEEDEDNEEEEEGADEEESNSSDGDEDDEDDA